MVYDNEKTFKERMTYLVDYYTPEQLAEIIIDMEDNAQKYNGAVR